MLSSHRCSLHILPFANDSADDSTRDQPLIFSHARDDGVSKFGEFGCFRKAFIFLYLNARSIIPKIEQLHLLAKLTNAAAIAVTETWLDDTVSDN